MGKAQNSRCGVPPQADDYSLLACAPNLVYLKGTCGGNAGRTVATDQNHPRTLITNSSIE